jgi:hypothetical protein
MRHVKTIDWLAKAVMLLLMLTMTVPGAWALGSCKAKVNKKTGAITVKASGVSGTLLWGWTAGMEVMEFHDEAGCISGSTANNCATGAPGTPDSITPPPLCTLHMKDDAGSCDAFVRGCVPGSRPLCPPDTAQVGSWCIDRVATENVEFDDAVAICQAKGRSLCPLEALIECDTNTAGSSFPALSCQSVTDSRSTWTITPNAADGINFFSVMTVYNGGNNHANVQSTSIGSLYNARCCQRLGGE